MVSRELFIVTIDSIDNFYRIADKLNELIHINLYDTSIYETIVNLCDYLIFSFTDDTNRELLSWYIFDKRDGLKFYINDSPVKINNAGELYDIIKKNEESD